MSRLSISEYAIRLAEVASLRSEDPYLKVGAVALTPEKRVIATAYNGLPKGYEASEKFWKDRDARLLYMVHAEQNLCSLIKRGQANIVAVTCFPCPSCMMLLIAHGIEMVLYRHEYERDERAHLIVAKYGIKIEKV